MRWWADEVGSGPLLLAPVLVAATMLAVAIVDVTAYLVAAAAAQTAADQSALAAAVARDHPGARGDPVGRARDVAEAADARLERCTCGAGTRPVEVEVSVAVRAAVITRFAGRRVHATASADVVPPGGTGPDVAP